jgi:hypothetical protein
MREMYISIGLRTGVLRSVGMSWAGEQRNSFHPKERVLVLGRRR